MIPLPLEPNFSTKLNNEEAYISHNRPVSEPVSEIQSDIESVEQDASLFIQENFSDRAKAIDFIEFQIIEQIEWLLPNAIDYTSLQLLKKRAEKARSTLLELDNKLYKKLRERIQKGKNIGGKFKELVNKCVDIEKKDKEGPDYDDLDTFINGLFQINDIPEQLKELEPEMVFYQKTPARIIFELVEKFPFTENDVFFDLGSGLGQVAILVNLLTGITTRGIEYEPAFCDYASDCAAALNLSNVSFINTDARQADYSKGTVFFMFTPFSGEMMQEVLEILRKESLERRIKVITYGPCTADVALESWMHGEMVVGDNDYKLGIFESLCVF